MKTLRLDHMASGRWQKTVSYKDCGPFRFDLESYNEFYNFTQGEYLPEVYSCVYTDEDTLELEYEHIHSEIKFPPIVIDEKGSRFINKTIKKIALVIVPDFFRFSNQNSETQHFFDSDVYFHTDLKMDNFVITPEGNPYLIDIDSMGWMPSHLLADLEIEYEV
jgi:hypothetical protein